MASYYYLIASLPEISADGDMPMTYEEFLSSCRSHVSDREYNLLENLTLSSTEGPLVKEWAGFYTTLMRELNYQRSVNLGRNYPVTFERDIFISRVVTSVLEAKNPLAAERMLLDYEFKNLDALVGLHMFDDYVLFGYAIKLKLLERLSCFEQEKGKAEFQSLFDGIQRQVYSL